MALYEVRPSMSVFYAGAGEHIADMGEKGPLPACEGGTFPENVGEMVVCEVCAGAELGGLGESSLASTAVLCLCLRSNEEGCWVTAWEASNSHRT